MTLRLTVRESAWRAHVAETAAAFPGLVPVVKGNGYGFGRTTLAAEALKISPTIAVGTVHELAGLPAGAEPVVLTPTMSPPVGLAANVVLTIGAPHHLDALCKAGWSGSVLVKVESPMLRYGRSPAEAVELAAAAREHGLDVAGFSVHPPIAGPAAQNAREIEATIAALASSVPIWTSHLDAAAYSDLRSRHPERTWRIRLGTALWHGDKRPMHLDATVLDVRAVPAGTRAGYRMVEVPGDGHLVVVAAGTAHGVHPLDGGLSPFHFARRRLALLEPPHMHTSMLFTPAAGPAAGQVPVPGDRVDVQRPLTWTLVDEVVWA